METCFWKHIPFLLYIFFSFPCLTLSQPDFIQQFCQENKTNTAYQENLDTLLSTLAPNTDGYGFYNSSYGDNPNTAHAKVLCRGDTEIQTCRSCIKNATAKLPQKCPNSKEAFGWYERCMLWYSNKSINGILEILPPFYAWNEHNASNVDKFNEAVNGMLEDLRKKAANGGERRKFATGSTSGPDLTTIYGLVQCTPDLSADDCSQCLTGAKNDISSCCDRDLYGKKGARAYKPSCHLQYETDYIFYNNSQIFNNTPSVVDAPPSPSSPPGPGKKDDDLTRTIIITVASVAGFGIVLALCFCAFARKRKQKKPQQRIGSKHKAYNNLNIKVVDDTSGIDISDEPSLQYDFDTVCVATNNFHDANKLGQGGFGAVYKGKLLNGQEIAVKRLADNSGQGELEFKNEVMLMAKLSHRNLVRLLGFCLEGEERLLIYEFVPNSSLDKFIFSPIRGALLDWERRFKIISGIAKGLLYLHEDSRLRIIHRDLKASNILLDAEMVPKIADFGIARLVVTDATRGSTNRIVGTHGYMPPEYVMYGHFSIKLDVFSFGVLILEIISGRKNNYFHNGSQVEHLISHAWKSWRDGTAGELVDPILRSCSGSMREMLRCVHIGLLCVQENVVDRPTMASVLLMLTSLSLDLPLPSEPAFFIGEHAAATTNRSSGSRNEMSTSELGPR